MAEKIREIAEIPREFIHDGNQVCLRQLRCSCSNPPCLVPRTLHEAVAEGCALLQSYLFGPVLSGCCAEFIQISKAVAIGFAVMGFIGYFVKLIHIPMYAFQLVHRVLAPN